MIRAGARAIAACLAAGAVPAALAAQAEAGTVQVQMREVAFHLDSTVVLDIQRLRGELRRRTAGQPPLLDDKQSFTLAIDSARIGISPRALSDLLNRYTFAYPGAALRGLRVTIENGQLKQEGRLRGISFTVVGDLTLTPEGELRLHPTSMKAIGIKVGGLMKFFGLSLQKMVDTKHARGVRIEGDDFIMSPTGLLPPPSVEGKVGALEVNDSEIVQVFVPRDGKPAPALKLPVQAKHYMFFREGVLRFGKLTMRDTDLLILDAEPDDVFDFFLDHYNDQLVAGFSRNTRDHGLIVVMPDFDKLQDSARGRVHPPAEPR